MIRSLALFWGFPNQLSSDQSASEPITSTVNLTIMQPSEPKPRLTAAAPKRRDDTEPGGRPLSLSRTPTRYEALRGRRRRGYVEAPNQTRIKEGQ
jgi:hypothetical protein